MQNPEKKRASRRRWSKKKKNRAKLRAYNRAWKEANPEKVKAHKKKAASKYALRRRMLYENRTPERIAEDNKKAMEQYHRRYPNRTPEQVERDKERNRAKYQKFLDAKREAEHQRADLKALRIQVETGKDAAARLEEIEKARRPVLIGDDRMVMKKPGPKLDVERGAYVYELREVQRLQWDPILERVEAHFHCQTTTPALRDLLRRYLKHLALQESTRDNSRVFHAG